MADSGGLAALGANKLNLIGIEGSFSLDKAAGLAHSAGFNMLGYDVDAFNNNLALFGADLKNLAGLARSLPL